MADLPPLVQGLLDPQAYPHAVAAIEMVETHISWVFLTGQFAYKVKKPVRLDFVDFSTLKQRREACEDELRLNRRYAPQIYLDVMPLTQEPANTVKARTGAKASAKSQQQKPRVDGSGDVIEYAVKMVQFPAQARLDRVLAAGEFLPTDCDLLAKTISASHGRAAIATGDKPFGEPVTVAGQVRDVLKSLGQLARAGPHQELTERISAWIAGQLAQLTPTFERRKSAGWIRECHGDLHSENIVMFEGQPVPFDCLEFREDLRWIDCMSDVGFIGMDLADRDHARFAHRLLNAYIEQTGDITGLDVLRFYQVYRALVRALVTALQGAVASVPGQLPDRATNYLHLAERFTRPRRAALVITHGVSGTGKTTATQELLEHLGAVRLRSDVERRRRSNNTATVDVESSADRYTPAARQAVYKELCRKAEIGLAAGYPIIVDATFLRRAHRDAFRELAAQRKVPFVILDFDAPAATLRQRIIERQRAGKDTSEATLTVLDQQLAEREPLAHEEREHVLLIQDGDLRLPLDRLRNIIEP